jgi:hypothetical protein
MNKLLERLKHLLCRRSANKTIGGPPHIAPEYIPGMQGRFCTGCGKPEVVVNRVREDFCQKCHDLLLSRLRARKEVIEKFGPYHKDNRGPNFLAIFLTGDTTLGFPILIADTPADAMAYALRVAERNAWKLLRLDIQATLTDIFRSDDYKNHFRTDRNKSSPLPFDERLYGPIPALWAA